MSETKPMPVRIAADIVDLNPDRNEVEQLGAARWTLARKKGRNPRCTKVERDIGIMHGVERDIMGVKGEFSPCRGLDIEPEITRATSFGDPKPGCDFIWQEFNCEGKWSKHRGGHLFFQPDTASSR